MSAIERELHVVGLTEWEAANPEYCKGWDAALRAANELVFHVYCREFGVGDVVHDTPIGRTFAHIRRLLRQPTPLEQQILEALRLSRAAAGEDKT